MEKFFDGRKRALLHAVLAGNAILCLCAPTEVASQGSDPAHPGLMMGALPEDNRLGLQLQPPEKMKGLPLVQTNSPGFSVSDIAGQAGKPIPLGISVPTTQAANYSFVMIRGLPADFTVSAGFKIRNAWMVALPDLKDLTLTPSANFEGSVPLEILLVRGRDVEPESRKITVTARTAAAKQPALEVVRPEAPKGLQMAAPTPPARQADPRPAQDVSAAEETALLTSGATALKQGNISAARIMFEEIAGRGSARGAFALAQTYDPSSLPAVTISGVKPDAAKAQFWYEKARELGSQDAERRLTEIRAGR